MEETVTEKGTGVSTGSRKLYVAELRLEPRPPHHTLPLMHLLPSWRLCLTSHTE